ncbi:cytosolic sulfotransferase 15-like [Senna tora]|uniref:Cytosolic sulfotransferase 15-like n=1 Tax=Senna tora TaxID=362788 RepID=A0A834X1B3_9FABA|nr:cytosolic sulfotransferase 15-like [Senna tora]
MDSTSSKEEKPSLKGNNVDDDEELLHSLPKQKGWGAYDLLLFHHHWIAPPYLKATISFQKHFQAKHNDIIVANLYADDSNNVLPYLSTLPEPRLFGTHLSFPLLPNSTHNSNSLALEEAFEKYCEGIFDYGPFRSHMLGYWKASKDTPNKKPSFFRRCHMQSHSNLSIDVSGRINGALCPKAMIAKAECSRILSKPDPEARD